MEIPIPGKDGLYFGTGPWCLRHSCVQTWPRITHGKFNYLLLPQSHCNPLLTATFITLCQTKLGLHGVFANATCCKMMRFDTLYVSRCINIWNSLNTHTHYRSAINDFAIIVNLLNGRDGIRAFCALKFAFCNFRPNFQIQISLVDIKAYITPMVHRIIYTHIHIYTHSMYV